MRADDLAPFKTKPCSSSGGKTATAFAGATTARGCRRALSEYNPAVETIKIIPQYLRLVRKISGCSDLALARSVTWPSTQLKNPAPATATQKKETLSRSRGICLQASASPTPMSAPRAIANPRRALVVTAAFTAPPVSGDFIALRQYY